MLHSDCRLGEKTEYLKHNVRDDIN